MSESRAVNINGAGPIAVGERVDAAAQLVATGRHPEAEAMLREILERDPGNADAVNTFASIALARRDGKRAYEILAPACTAYPNHSRLMSNLGLAHMMLDRPKEAVACLDRAIAIAPYDAEIRMSLAQFLAAAGEPSRAAQELETVLQHDPRNAEAFSRLGIVAIANGDPARAEAAWRQAVAIDPKHADALQNLSVLCASSGRAEEAAVLAERAHIWAPLDIAKRVQFARCRAGIGDFEAAQTACKNVLMVAPDHLAATELFARLTLIRGAIPAGIETLSYHVRRHPKDPDAILALAGALRFVGRMPQALTFIDQALAVAPDHPFGQRLRADLLLTLGRFRDVWPNPVAPGDLPPRVVAPKGTSTIDALVFGRFLAALSPDGVEVTSFADGMATGLLRHIRGVRLVEPDPDKPDIEGLALQSMPGALGVERDAMGVAGCFLTPDPAALERWRAIFADLPRPLIGIDWDQYRPGARADAIVPLAAGRGTVVGLAVDPERRQLDDWPQVFDAGAEIRNAADLIAAVSCLDAIVATDGLPLHVAGALEIPGVALTACGYPWYLAANGDRAIWYRSLLVARQSSPGDWKDALNSASTAIASMLAAPAGDYVQ
jgi:tetratricopeptide (TPR) repeat protein